MDNYKFLSLLASSPLSESERYNLNTIFNTLTPNRKLEIIDGWSHYLDRILEIKRQDREERDRSIRETFEKINQLIDDAYLREQEQKRTEERERQQEQQDRESAALYDQQRKMAELQKNLRQLPGM